MSRNYLMIGFSSTRQRSRSPWLASTASGSIAPTSSAAVPIAPEQASTLSSPPDAEMNFSPPSGGVCVKAPRNTVLHLEIALWQKQDFWSRGHRPIVDTCANEAIPQWGKPQPDQLCVPAIRIWNCWQAVPLRCLPALRLNSMSVRSMSVSISTNFDNFQLQIRSVFEPNFRLRFSLNSTSATYDNLVYNFSPMNGFFRTIFNVCVNWGLWDNLSLPRTTPDNHVELSSVCVCVFGCLHLDHFLCFQIQAYPARLRGPTNSKCFLSILTKLENLRTIDLSEIPTKRWSPSRQSPAGTKCLLSYREVCSGDSGAAKWMVQNWGGHQPFVINEIYNIYIYINVYMYI